MSACSTCRRPMECPDCGPNLAPPSDPAAPPAIDADPHTSCPFCGAPGEYVTADEGTSYFRPDPAAPLTPEMLAFVQQQRAYNEAWLGSNTAADTARWLDIFDRLAPPSDPAAPLDIDGKPFCPTGYAQRYHATGECERRDALEDLREFVANEPAREGAGLYYAVSQVRILDYIDHLLAAAPAPKEADRE